MIKQKIKEQRGEIPHCSLNTEHFLEFLTAVLICNRFSDRKLNKLLALKLEKNFKHRTRIFIKIMECSGSVSKVIGIGDDFFEVYLTILYNIN